MIILPPVQQPDSCEWLWRCAIGVLHIARVSAVGLGMATHELSSMTHQYVGLPTYCISAHAVKV